MADQQAQYQQQRQQQPRFGPQGGLDYPMYGGQSGQGGQLSASGVMGFDPLLAPRDPYDIPTNSEQYTFKMRVKAWWASMPVFARTLFWCTFAVYVSTWLGTGAILALLMSCSVQTIIEGKFVWTLLTGSLLAPAFMILLLGCYLYLPLVSNREKEYGTIKTIVWWTYNTVAINSIFFLLNLILTQVYSVQYVIPVVSFFGLFISELVVLGAKDPASPVGIMCCPCYFRAASLPWILICVLSLVYFPVIPSDLIAGMIVGYLNKRQTFRFLISDGRAASLESGCLQMFSTHPKYCRINNRELAVSSMSIMSMPTVNQVIPQRNTNQVPAGGIVMGFTPQFVQENTTPQSSSQGNSELVETDNQDVQQENSETRQPDNESPEKNGNTLGYDIEYDEINRRTEETIEEKKEGVTPGYKLQEDED
eukprot:CAMPEP_0114997542 /NCGR_PEP_ID=MMETSP0216-20121206/14963_1 /TAXON_ID=223996 /ORGANISM="Protocruzia adherens, Strain Boccale" /LENGTH=421 /DNA_ID=CAMNT_0002361947 /DNA_START=84 /DNA_END=1349 /DNA_ORIENTATION=-